MKFAQTLAVVPWILALCATSSIAARNDFDNDARSDIGVYDPACGNWYIMKSTEGLSVTQFGFPGTMPVTGDFDGDGRQDIGCYALRSGNWYFLTTSQGFKALQFGFDGALPVTGDFDGDGTTDYGCSNPKNGDCYMVMSSRGFSATRFVASGAFPVIKDVNNDGRDEIAYAADERSALAIPGDYDGDGREDAAYYTAETGTWDIRLRTGTARTVQFGFSRTLPLGNRSWPAPPKSLADELAQTTWVSPDPWHSYGGINIEVYFYGGGICAVGYRTSAEVNWHYLPGIYLAKDRYIFIRTQGTSSERIDILADGISAANAYMYGYYRYQGRVYSMQMQKPPPEVNYIF